MANRSTYLNKSLSQIPRILTSMDRNVLSPTYGCCHRDYWLYKTSDFPDAVRQFGLHALALVYSSRFKDNIYYRNKNILKWTIAGLKFWAEIQHADGSFDEFYPNERGWVGPTAFTTYTAAETLKILKEDMSLSEINHINNAIKKASLFIIKGQSEEDHLANHHAMACLAVWKSYKLLGEDILLKGYEKLWKNFVSYCDLEEGWSKEYDGIDPGYLSATISFLGKIYQDNKDKRILDICKKSIEMCSLFVYPNGFYAGSIGSRNTQHFYPHGFEIFGNEVPLSLSVANKMLLALDQNKLVPPEIMSDRYLFYRVPELIQCYIDYQERGSNLPQLPYEKENLNSYFPNSKIFVLSNKNSYLIINLAKGGVLKVFNKIKRELLLSDDGILGVLDNGKTVSSQWIDNSYKIQVEKDIIKVRGNLNIIPTNKYFNLLKNIIFRLFLLLFAWNTNLAHKLKGWIRKILMLGNRSSEIFFERSFEINTSEIVVKNVIKNKKKKIFKQLYLGGDFFIRYVPQSRFYQEQELLVESTIINSEQLNKLNLNENFIISYKINI